MIKTKQKGAIEYATLEYIKLVLNCSPALVLNNYCQWDPGVPKDDRRQMTSNEN